MPHSCKHPSLQGPPRGPCPCCKPLPWPSWPPLLAGTDPKALSAAADAPGCTAGGTLHAQQPAGWWVSHRLSGKGLVVPLPTAPDCCAADWYTAHPRAAATSVCMHMCCICTQAPAAAAAITLCTPRHHSQAHAAESLSVSWCASSLPMLSTARASLLLLLGQPAQHGCKWARVWRPQGRGTSCSLCRCRRLSSCNSAAGCRVLCLATPAPWPLSPHLHQPPDTKAWREPHTCMSRSPHIHTTSHMLLATAGLHRTLHLPGKIPQSWPLYTGGSHACGITRHVWAGRLYCPGDHPLPA